MFHPLYLYVTKNNKWNAMTKISRKHQNPFDNYIFTLMDIMIFLKKTIIMINIHKRLKTFINTISILDVQKVKKSGISNFETNVFNVLIKLSLLLKALST